MTQTNSRTHYGPLCFNLIHKSVMTCVSTISYPLSDGPSAGPGHLLHFGWPRAHPVHRSDWIARCATIFSFRSIFFGISIWKRQLTHSARPISIRLFACDENSHVSMSRRQRHDDTLTLHTHEIGIVWHAAKRKTSPFIIIDLAWVANAFVWPLKWN